MLQQHDPEAAQGLQAILRLPSQQYQQVLQVEGRPADTSKQQYVDLALQQLLVEDVSWQFEALQQGFSTVLEQQVGWNACMAAAQLNSLNELFSCRARSYSSNCNMCLSAAILSGTTSTYVTAAAEH
jgi:hypothetical protein